MSTKTILITGCSSGFGYHTAVYLSQHHYHVYATVRKQADLNVFSHLPVPNRPIALLLDLTWNQARISRVINQLSPKPTILINNAGFGYLGAVGTLSVSHLQRQLDINLLGTHKVTHAVLPHMRSQKQGLIINVSSILGLVAFPGYGIYSASKFALEALTQSLRLEEAVYGIDVVSLNPGSFDTNFRQNQKFPPRHHSLPTSHDRFNRRLRQAIQKRPPRHTHSDAVATKISKLITSRHRPLNNPVGLDAHLIYFSYRLLPRSLFFFLLQKLTQRLS